MSKNPNIWELVDARYLPLMDLRNPWVRIKLVVKLSYHSFRNFFKYMKTNDTLNLGLTDIQLMRFARVSAWFQVEPDVWYEFLKAQDQKPE